MSINAESLIAAIEESDELRAKGLVLRDACDHAHRVARQALLPNADYPEICARVREVLDTARKLCDSLNDAQHRKGYEIADEEIIVLAKAAGGWHFLAGEAQIRWLAARKRAALYESRNGSGASARAGDGTPEGTGPVVRSPIALHRD